MKDITKTSLLAWMLWSLAAAMIVAKVLLFVINLQASRSGVFSFHGSSILFPLPFATIGLLIGFRQSRNPIGWFFLANGLFGGSLTLGEDYAVYGLITRPGSLPGAVYAAWMQNLVWVPLIGLTAFVAPPVFSDGRLLNKGWRFCSS